MEYVFFVKFQANVSARSKNKQNETLSHFFMHSEGEYSCESGIEMVVHLIIASFSHSHWIFFSLFFPLSHSFRHFRLRRCRSCHTSCIGLDSFSCNSILDPSSILAMLLWTPKNIEERIRRLSGRSKENCCYCCHFKMAKLDGMYTFRFILFFVSTQLPSIWLLSHGETSAEPRLLSVTIK